MSTAWRQQTPDLSHIQRRNAVIGRASLQRVQPLRCLRSRGHHDNRQRSIDSPQPAQQRQILPRHAAHEHNVCLQELSHRNQVMLFPDSVSVKFQQSRQL